MTMVAHVPNLFDRSRFMSRVTFVETPEEALELGPTLVFVDLDRCQDIEGFRLDGIRVIGFGPHVDTNLHAQAVEAGYSEVFPRSVFFKRLTQLLGSAE